MLLILTFGMRERWYIAKGSSRAETANLLPASPEIANKGLGSGELTMSHTSVNPDFQNCRVIREATSLAWEAIIPNERVKAEMKSLLL